MSSYGGHVLGALSFTYEADAEMIAKRLREEKLAVKQLGFTLALLLPQSKSEIDGEVHRICEWMEDACEALAPGSLQDRVPE